MDDTASVTAFRATMDKAGESFADDSLQELRAEGITPTAEWEAGYREGIKIAMRVCAEATIASKAP